MRESVPTARYSPVCNVLRQWKTSLILTYRVYRLYDIYIIMTKIFRRCTISVGLAPLANKCAAGRGSEVNVNVGECERRS